MKFTAVDPIPDRDKHLLHQWESETGAVKVCIEPICGAVRITVWYERPDCAYPDILRCIWDTPPDGRMLEILESIFDAFADFPPMASQRDVQARLQILMFEEYGDIFDGSRARPIDRDHERYNPHANPWWNDAQRLRKDLADGCGVYRHNVDLHFDLPPLGDSWIGPDTDAELEKPPEWIDDTPQITHHCNGCGSDFATSGGGADPYNDSMCPICGSHDTEITAEPTPKADTTWLESAWKNDRENDELNRPNPAWVGPPKPYNG